MWIETGGTRRKREWKKRRASPLTMYGNAPRTYVKTFWAAREGTERTDAEPFSCSRARKTSTLADVNSRFSKAWVRAVSSSSSSNMFRSSSAVCAYASMSCSTSCSRSSSSWYLSSSSSSSSSLRLRPSDSISLSSSAWISCSWAAARSPNSALPSAIWSRRSEAGSSGGEEAIGGAAFCPGQRGGTRGAGRAGLHGAEERRARGRGGGGRRVPRLSSEDEAELDRDRWDEEEEPRTTSLSSPKSMMEKWRNVRDRRLGSELTLASPYEEVKLFSNSKSCWESLVSRSPAEVARASKVAADVGAIPLEPRGACWERCPVVVSASPALAWRASFFCTWPSARLNSAWPRPPPPPPFAGLWWRL
ncbi:hypothetical protein EYF80_022034 [Liparis tanakae]|uniref:Uncharacterized protein n=1 Tax=Liparis tanakae TaxID=230148 RepID=A0A4Z2HPI2_9TELE|nr:hypothetical protein EYF80_022034 [Liparis tanakae]